MFTLVWTAEAKAQYDAQYDALKGDLRKQAEKTIRLIAENPRHPGLRSHKYHSVEGLWESYVQNRIPGAYRLFWRYDGNRIILVSIRPHT